MAIQRFIQISDTHCYEMDDARLAGTDLQVFPNRSLQAVLNHLKDRIEDHSALVLTGDIAQEETAQTYERVTKILSDFPLSIYAIPGNHDSPELMRTHLGGEVRQISSATYGKWTIFFLNTHCAGEDGGHLSDSELFQFESKLNEISKHEYAVIFMHHHPLDIGNKQVDGMCLRNKDFFWNIVEKYPQVRAVFHGHIHHEFSDYHSYGIERKVAVYGTPSTCVQGKPNTQRIEIDHAIPGWREIAFHPDGHIDTQVLYLPK